MKPKRADDVMETVLRMLMQEFIDHGTLGIFFISIDGRDPPKEFLHRFADIPRIIKNKSDAEYRSQKGGRGPRYFFDRQTGERGSVFETYLRWLRGSFAEAIGQYTCSGLNGRIDGFRLELVGDRWIVKDQRKIAVS